MASDQNTAVGFGSKPYRSYVLGSLLVVYIFNFIDRSIINILTEPIKIAFEVEDWQMGLLGGPAFAFMYTFLGIPIARLAERFNRVWIIAISVAFWSLMTALCGFAASFLMLFLFRVGVSVGEAGCTPPSQSLMSDYYSPKTRSTAASVYALGVPMGTMLAAIFGGTIAEKLTGPAFGNFLNSIGLSFLGAGINWENVEGWRLAFIVVGLPGILVALIVKLTVKEPPRGYTDPSLAKTTEHVSFISTLKLLLGKPTYVHIVLGATVTVFANYALNQFTVSFFRRTHDLSQQDASLLFGIILGGMAAIGVFASGYLADKLRERHPTALTWIPGIALIASTPLYVIGFITNNIWIAVPPLMAAACLHYFYLGPMYAIAGGVVDSRSRATSVALSLFSMNLLGYGLGPPLIGTLSTFLNAQFLGDAEEGLNLDLCRDVSLLTDAQAGVCNAANADGLQWSMIVFSCAYAWAGIHYVLARRHFKKDMISL